jgi:8-oxo-dGTP pyrophosphatase MutT (NUDIX family)
MPELAPAIPAATLVLMRPGPQAPELLAMERAAEMAFAPGAIVFPGGRIDADDYTLADRIGGTLEHAAARITAIRETLEEVGIVAGFATAPAADLIPDLRSALAAGEPFSALLERFGLALDLAALTPFAQWCPPFNPVRRFDTLFFVADAPSDADPPQADQSEAVHSFWACARHILDEADAGRLTVIYPTRRNLERLAQFASIEEARADAAAHPVQRVETYIEERDGERWLCIPEGLGYPVTAERIGTVRRGWEHGEPS